MKKRKDNKGRVLKKGEIQRNDGRYAYRYTDAYGMRREIYSVDLKRLRAREKEIGAGSPPSGAGSGIKLNDLFKQYMELKPKLAITTRERYEATWNRHIANTQLGEKKIRDIKRSDILKCYCRLVEKGYKSSSIKCLDAILSPCLEFAVEDGLIPKNPAKRCVQEVITNDKKHRTALTAEEQQIFLNYAREHYYREYLMYKFLIGTAMRLGEAAGLTWSDVDLKNREVKVDHQLYYFNRNKTGMCFYTGKPKTAAGTRIIPLTDSVCDALKEYRKLQLANGTGSKITIDGYRDFVFTTRSGGLLKAADVNYDLKRIVEECNRQETIYAKRQNRAPVLLPRISAHILRHTGCTRMAEAGVDVKVMQAIMGHSNAQTTLNVYTHASTTWLHEEIDKLESSADKTTDIDAKKSVLGVF